MTLRTNHVINDTGHTDDHNAIATQVNQNTSDIAANKGLPVGATGATQPTRYVGRWAATGAPASGTFAVGDFGFDGTNAVQICTVAGTPGTWAGSAASGASLTPTAVKTANYSALASDLVPVDTTSGNITVTLPSAPADKTLVGVKHHIRGGTNTVSVACGGTDHFSTSNAAARTLTVLGEAIVAQYQASTGLWFVTATDTPFAQITPANIAAQPAAYPSSLTGSGATLANTYDPACNVYNAQASTFRRTRAAIAKTNAAAGPARILCLGDSITAGSHTTGNLYQNRYAARLKTLLGTLLGGTAAEGAVWMNNVWDDTTRFVTGTGWFTMQNSKGAVSAASQMGFGGGGVISSYGNPAGSLDIAIGYAWDTCIVYFYSGGGFTYQVDAGGTTTQADTTGVTLRSVTISASLATHTLHITSTSAGQTFLAGFEFFDSTSKPILISASGVSSATVADYTTTGATRNTTQLLATYTPHLTFIMLGMNDCRSDIGISTSTYQTDLTSLVGTLQTGGSDVVFITNYQSDATNQGSIQPYNKILYTLADSLGCGVLDLNDRWPSNITTLLNEPYAYLFTDHIHPVNRGHWDLALSAYQAIRKNV